MNSIHIFLLGIICLGFSVRTSAQDMSTGVFSSFVGHGLSLEIDHRSIGEIDAISLYIDTYGIPTGRTKDLGVALCYSRKLVFGVLDTESFIARFHAGFGLMSGYVHDYEKGMWSENTIGLKRNMGAVLALSCQAGVRLDFHRPICMVISFEAYPGIHIRQDELSSTINVSLYKNGVFNCLIPRLSILYRF